MIDAFKLRCLLHISPTEPKSNGLRKSTGGPTILQLPTPVLRLVGIDGSWLQGWTQIAANVSCIY